MYVNGIVFGLGELTAIVLSGWLMQKFMDITAFRVSWALGVLGFGALICFPESLWLPYLGILLSIWSIGGWINTQVLILEMRVHPQKVGFIAVVCRTVGVGVAIVSPTISNLQAPYPLLTLLVIAFIALLLTFMLPPPGLYLPKV